MKIRFEGVGRNRATWTAAVPCGTDRGIAREAKRGGMLMSSAVEVVWNDDNSGGDIVVGGIRTVGAFEVIEETERAK